MAGTGQAPRVRRYTIPYHAALGAAVDATLTACQAEFAGTVTKVAYVPDATQAGAAAPNNRALSLVNLGQAGAGNTVVATETLDGVGGDNLAIGTPNSLPITAANATVAAGDVLQWKSVHAGTGIADPGGTLIVEVTSN